MHVLQFTPIFLLAATAATSVLPEEANKYPIITCQTSGASPSTFDVTGAINQLKGKGNTGFLCAQNNGVKSKCTKLAEHGGAQIGVCGNNGGPEKVYHGTCGQYAECANLVQQQCLSGDRSGGTCQFNADLRIIVY